MAEIEDLEALQERAAAAVELARAAGADHAWASVHSSRTRSMLSSTPSTSGQMRPTMSARASMHSRCRSTCHDSSRTVNSGE